MEVIGIILGMVASFIVGFIWYSKAIFGKQFAELTKMDMTTKPTSKQWIGAAVNAFLVTVVLSWVLTSVGVQGVGDSLFTATALWAGFVFTPFFGQVLWAKMPMKQLVIQAGCMLVTMWVISVILALV